MLEVNVSGRQLDGDTIVERAVMICRRAKLISVSPSMMGMPLWLEAKLQPRYSEKPFVGLRRRPTP
jgi:hypothetical protein